MQKALFETLNPFTAGWEKQYKENLRDNQIIFENLPSYIIGLYVLTTFSIYYCSTMKLSVQSNYFPLLRSPFYEK